ncbi:MAG: TlpA family protein disulfide reductase [Acidobacteria bacterium]|nr:TlpA family protein disulfide reductase [Acidobacteriota bacterium]
MRLKFPESFCARSFNLRRAAAFAAVLALAAVAASCELDGASKKRAEASRNAAASGAADSRMPRTNLPMPPVSASRGASLPVASGGSPRGAWTQLDGRRASLEDLRGQVVVLDFWATYCPPCREEIPHLVRLQRQFGPQGFKVIGLNVGGPEDRPKVPEFVRLYGIQYELAEPDPETTRLFLADNSAIPQTFVLDRRGRLVRHFVGYDPEVASELERAVADALAEKAD